MQKKKMGNLTDLHLAPLLPAEEIAYFLIGLIRAEIFEAYLDFSLFALLI